MTILNEKPNCPLQEEKVREALKCLRLLNEKDTKNKSELFNEDQPIILQLALKRIPKIQHVLALRLNLKHPIVKDRKSICLITKDLVKGKREYEDDVAHWQELLKSKDIEVGEIIPLKQLKTEYKTYEAKNNLSNGFELFLVDATLTHLMPTILGHAFVKRKKMPYGVNLDEKKVKVQFERALKKTTMNVAGKGPVCSCRVGYLGLSEQELLDNVTEVASDICRKLPGGWKNVDSVHLKFPSSIALPVYMSFESARQVKIDKIKDDRETIIEDVTTLSRSNVKIHPSLKVDLLKEEPEDLTELEHTSLPFEDHDLALQEVEAWKKKLGKKKISEKKLLAIIKKREGQRKRMLEKLRLKAELQEQANFKEAEALKASQSTEKTSVAGDVKSKSLLNVINPFSSVGEKILKKSVKEKEAKTIKDQSVSKKKTKKEKQTIETPVSPLKKKLRKKQKKEPKVENSPKSLTQERIEKQDQKIESTLNIKKKRKRALRKRTALNPDLPQETTKTAMLQKRFEVQKLKSRKRKDSSDHEDLKIAPEEIKKNKKQKRGGKKTKQAAPALEQEEKPAVLEKTNTSLKSGKNKYLKSESPRITSEKEMVPLKKRMSLTSQLGKLGSLRKKKSYNMSQVQAEKMSPKKNKRERNQPQLLSIKQQLEEPSLDHKSLPTIMSKKDKKKQTGSFVKAKKPRN